MKNSKGVIYILTKPLFSRFVRIGYADDVKSAIAGPKYFKYKGEWLNSIRQRLGV